MKLDVKGIDKVISKINGMKGRVRDLTPVASVIQEDLVKLVSDAFRNETDPNTGAKWVPLKPKTAARKADAGKEKILRWSGTLANSIASRFDRNAGDVFVGTNVPYGVFHQKGVRKGVWHKGRKHKDGTVGDPFVQAHRIPARRFLPSGQDYKPDSPFDKTLRKIYSRVRTFLIEGTTGAKL